jgi:hypothetical protein
VDGRPVLALEAHPRRVEFSAIDDLGLAAQKNVCPAYADFQNFAA